MAFGCTVLRCWAMAQVRVLVREGVLGELIGQQPIRHERPEANKFTATCAHKVRQNLTISAAA
jgi:hypothetical protein